MLRGCARWSRGSSARGVERGWPRCYLPWPINVWQGVSVEGPKVACRVDELREVPAAVRFLSVEPFIAALPELHLTGIDWVIVGGESGPGARPMDPAWVRDVHAA